MRQSFLFRTYRFNISVRWIHSKTDCVAKQMFKLLHFRSRTAIQVNVTGIDTI